MNAIQKLSETDVARAPFAPAGTMKVLNDGNGLRLLIDSSSKAWRYRYKLDGKDKLMSLGVYPKVNLIEARAAAKAARELLERGENPQAARQLEKDRAYIQGDKTFGTVAAEWNRKRAGDSDKGNSVKTIERVERMFRESKKLHAKTFKDIKAPAILAVCEGYQNRGKGTTDSAHRLANYISQVISYAIVKGYFEGPDPTPEGGLGKHLKAVREKHRPALTSPYDVGGLMRNIDTWEFLMMGPTVSRALQLLARTAVRPGELRAAEWSEFDLDGAKHDGHPTWVIPVDRMKMRDDNRTDHIVPLSRQAVAILKEQQGLTGEGRYVFPNERSKSRPLSDGALPQALINLSYRDQHTAHGFRTTFKTLSQDQLRVDSELVERQLAHKVGSGVAAAYDRSQRLDERRKLMQDYSDLLEKLRG